MTRTKFTLIEVVVALTILALGLSTSLALATIAKQRMFRAQEKWRNQHMLEQAAEYYLLNPGSNDIDQRIFPYKDFYAACSVEPCEDELPDDIDNLSGSWQLSTAKIKVLEREGSKEVKSVNVDLIMKGIDK